MEEGVEGEDEDVVDDVLVVGEGVFVDDVEVVVVWVFGCGEDVCDDVFCGSLLRTTGFFLAGASPPPKIESSSSFPSKGREVACVNFFFWEAEEVEGVVEVEVVDVEEDTGDCFVVAGGFGNCPLLGVLFCGGAEPPKISSSALFVSKGSFVEEEEVGEAVDEVVDEVAEGFEVGCVEGDTISEPFGLVRLGGWRPARTGRDLVTCSNFGAFAEASTSVMGALDSVLLVGGAPLELSESPIVPPN